MVKPATIKVSVIVPVYNPGPHIDGLVASLRRQSMRAAEFEVIFVDDGSTDGTGERLERWAAEVSNFRVIRIANSGWPGRPRNTGVDAARGEYLQFVDHDDELGDEALERLWRLGRANGSDVVIGREETRNNRTYLNPMFAQSRSRAVLGKDPLLDLLTPHKMFRRSFLEGQGIRFGDGRRLEDHEFVTKAYFRADVISVLADYPCYYWIRRSDGGNTGRGHFESPSYYDGLRGVLEVVKQHTELGPFRDELLSHWYRGKGLELLSQAIVALDDAAARARFDGLRDLAQEWFPPSVDNYLAPVMQLRSSLLRAGDVDRFRALAEAEHGMKVKARLEDVRVVDRCLELKVKATLAYADGSPVLLTHQAERAYWQPPIALGDAVPPPGLELTTCASETAAEVILRTATGDTVRLPGRTEPPLPAESREAPIQAVRVVRLDPRRLEHGRRMRTGVVWELDVQLGSCGWRARQLLKTATVESERRATAVGVPFRSRDSRARLVVGRFESGHWMVHAEPATPAASLRAAHRRTATRVRRRLLRLPGARPLGRRLRRGWRRARAAVRGASPGSGARRDA